MSKSGQCDRCGNFCGLEGDEFLVCAMHPLGPNETPCPDWKLVEDDGWFLVDEADADGELVMAQATLLDALDRNIEIMIHPKFTGRCPDCGFEFDRRQRSPVYRDCNGAKVVTR